MMKKKRQHRKEVASVKVIKKKSTTKNLTFDTNSYKLNTKHSEREVLFEENGC